MVESLIISAFLFLGASIFATAVWCFLMYIIWDDEAQKLKKAIEKNKIHLTRDSDLG